MRSGARLRRNGVDPSPPRGVEMIELNRHCRSRDPRCWHLVRALELECALALDIAPDCLFHPLQSGSVDDQRAEPTGCNFAPGGEGDLHVMVGGVAMLGGKPRRSEER